MLLVKISDTVVQPCNFLRKGVTVPLSDARFNHVTCANALFGVYRKRLKIYLSRCLLRCLLQCFSSFVWHCFNHSSCACIRQSLSPHALPRACMLNNVKQRNNRECCECDIHAEHAIGELCIFSNAYSQLSLLEQG